MSGFERNKGVLTPYVGEITEEMDYDPWDYGLIKINGVLYTKEFEVESDDDLYLEEVSVDDSGRIHFHTIHYNGGAGLEEVIESALRHLPKSDPNPPRAVEREGNSKVYEITVYPVDEMPLSWHDGRAVEFGYECYGIYFWCTGYYTIRNGWYFHEIGNKNGVPDIYTFVRSTLKLVYPNQKIIANK